MLLRIFPDCRWWFSDSKKTPLAPPRKMQCWPLPEPDSLFQKPSSPPLFPFRSEPDAFIPFGTLGRTGQVSVFFEIVERPGYGGLILLASLAQLGSRHGFKRIQVIQAGNMGAFQMVLRHLLILQLADIPADLGNQHCKYFESFFHIRLPSAGWKFNKLWVSILQTCWNVNRLQADFSPVKCSFFKTQRKIVPRKTIFLPQKSVAPSIRLHRKNGLSLPNPIRFDFVLPKKSTKIWCMHTCRTFTTILLGHIYLQHRNNFGFFPKTYWQKQKCMLGYWHQL